MKKRKWICLHRCVWDKQKCHILPNFLKICIASFNSCPIWSFLQVVQLLGSRLCLLSWDWGWIPDGIAVDNIWPNLGVENIGHTRGCKNIIHVSECTLCCFLEYFQVNFPKKLRFYRMSKCSYLALHKFPVPQLLLLSVGSRLRSAAVSTTQASAHGLIHRTSRSQTYKLTISDVIDLFSDLTDSSHCTSEGHLSGCFCPANMADS